MQSELSARSVPGLVVHGIPVGLELPKSGQGPEEVVRSYVSKIPGFTG